MSTQILGNATLTDTTLTELVPAQGAGLKIYVTSILVTNSHATVGTLVTFKDDTDGGTNILCQGYAAAAGGGFSMVFPSPRVTNDNKKLQVQCGTTGANVYVSVSGYKGI